MTNHPKSFLSAKCQARPIGKGHRGVFAVKPIKKDEVIAVWGGEIMTRDQFSRLPEEYRRLTLQVEEEQFVAGISDDPADFINHSCNPNAGLSGQIVLVAMRDIAPGEEVCFDYAMTDGSDYDVFDCECGAPNCRGRVRGTDWRTPELWDRYRGYFIPYLQRRIDRLRAEMKVAENKKPSS